MKIFLFNKNPLFKLKGANKSNFYESDIGRVSQVRCFDLQMIAIYCSVLFLFSFLSNLMLLRFLKSKLKRGGLNVFNIFMATIAIFNLIGTVIELPSVIISSISCRYRIFISYLLSRYAA